MTAPRARYRLLAAMVAVVAVIGVFLSFFFVFVLAPLVPFAVFYLAYLFTRERLERQQHRDERRLLEHEADERRHDLARSERLPNVQSEPGARSAS